MSKQPLEGIRVVDLTDDKGELTGRLLADFGADVIRVEPPRGGSSRALPPIHDGESLYFAHRNANKRGITLDLEQAEDRDKLHSLLSRADLMVESFDPGYLSSLGLDPDQLPERHRHLICLSISHFGQHGPYRDWVATDATMEAIGGMLFKAGVPEKPPLIPPGAIAYDTAGIMAAFASMLALLQRERTGYGQYIDLSVLESLAQITDWSFPNASHVRSKASESVELRMGSGPMYTIYACKTGYVRLVILSPRQWHAMREWLGDPEYLRDPFYDGFIGRMSIADALMVTIGDHFATMTHEEVSFEAQRRGIVCTPVLTPEEVLENEHFKSRQTFVDGEYSPGRSGPMCSGFFELDGERQGYRQRAPELGEHDAPPEDIWPDERPQPEGPRPTPSSPLEGIRVLDFGIGGVGVEASRLFAEYGAEVIKIESRTYPDFMRVVMGTEMSASFASSSRSKQGFGVNLKNDQGISVIRDLIRHADVIVENNSTGTMDDLEIGYAQVEKLNPRCVMASSQLLGSRGVWADWLGYGPSTQPIGGLVHLWNYTDQEFPAGSGAIFPDHLAGRLVALVALAALLRRQRTDHGGHGEVAQCEAVTGILGDLLLKTGLAPGSVKPTGGRSDRGAPWGAFPCVGDQQWVVISIRDDDDWKMLRMALGEPEWAMDPALEDARERFARQDEIESHLTEWTSSRTREDVTATLQMMKVPAAPMFTATDQICDPHYQARGYPHWIDQQDLGWICMEGPAFHAPEMGRVRIEQAPKLGEHTRKICRELLDMNGEAIEELVANGALEVPND